MSIYISHNVHDLFKQWIAVCQNALAPVCLSALLGGRRLVRYHHFRHARCYNRYLCMISASALANTPDIDCIDKS